ncbi:uncharacterized protein LOC124808463 [Hydra vulgaris]|uniref:uncharacterized protein LOC124808463 n=1 Tax=Hydra vulgaris TaxID=6087 RepID=UPI0032EA8025
MNSADRTLLDSLTVRSTQPITATSSSTMNGKFNNYFFLMFAFLDKCKYLFFKPLSSSSILNCIGCYIFSCYKWIYGSKKKWSYVFGCTEKSVMWLEKTGGLGRGRCAVHTSQP